jgi:hypothetical protein
MTDQPQSECTAGALSWPDDLLSTQRGAAIRLGSADRRDRTPELQAKAVRAHSLDIEIKEHDPVYQAAREVVQAVAENRWSLHAAAVVVALHRLCEALECKAA